MLKKIRLGDLLLKHNVLSQNEIESAVNMQSETGMKLGNVLIELGFIDETNLLRFLAEQLNISFIEIKNYQIKPEILRMIPETLARRHHAVPIDKVQGSFLLAMADPTDVVAFDEMSKRLPGTVEIAVVREADLLRVIDEVFRRTDEIATLAGEIEEEIGDINIISEAQASEDVPIFKLLNSIFEDAIQVNASDIHIEPDKDLIRIRHRVDGVLQEQIVKGKSILPALVLRLKLMAKLNISERRLPQEGRFTLKIKNKKVDIRMATMPIEGGEAIAMRIFDQTGQLKKLEELGMPPNILERYRELLAMHHGMILVTGPTGCGKSTTLYASLMELNKPEQKIITVEDPVEFHFSRINQVQVVPKIGLTFSRVLRSVLRHDPDILMVGEIRDEETASIALRAAMTGHLVLSTLHTNNAISSPGRLLEMGIPGYLVASALKLVIAQRLVRRVCLSCQKPYRPSPQETLMLNSLMAANTEGIHFLKGKGCMHCNNTGYKGRIGIYEVLEVNLPMMEALRSNNIQSFTDEARKTELFRSLIHWGLDYACMGLTTIDEVFRLLQDIDDE
ncbi:MAG TPA: GspE/PulE family protein [Gammaproteobacteria bacterium]|nr:GspE/PulE family protein [Gammaproteobacteria bacterium]